MRADAYTDADTDADADADADPNYLVRNKKPFGTAITVFGVARRKQEKK